LNAVEQEHPAKLKSFREVVKSKIVRQWTDVKDIKLAILEKLLELGGRDDLVGWIPSNQAVDSGALAEQIARLVKERDALLERLSKETDKPDFAIELHGAVSVVDRVRLSIFSPV
jgi:hypothetical protein